MGFLSYICILYLYYITIKLKVMQNSNFLLPSFRSFLRASNYAPKTITGYLSAVRQFFEYSNGRPISHSSVLRYLESIKSISKRKLTAQALKLLFENCLFDSSLAASVPNVAYTRPVYNVPSYTEIKNDIYLIEDEFYRFVFYTALYFGLRSSELLNIHTTDFNFRDRTLFIRKSKYDISRILKFSAEFEDELNYFLSIYSPSKYLFSKNIYSVMSLDNLHFYFHKYLPGLQKFHFLRHARITFLISQGINLAVVSKFAGHKSLNSTLYYYHHTPAAFDTFIYS